MASFQRPLESDPNSNRPMLQYIDKRTYHMKIDAYHKNRLATSRGYAAAVKAVDFQESLADLIVRLRVRRGLTQSELAKLAGTTQSTISLIENGDADPRTSTIGKIFNALSVPTTTAVRQTRIALTVGRRSAVSEYGFVGAVASDSRTLEITIADDSWEDVENENQFALAS